MNVAEGEDGVGTGGPEEVYSYFYKNLVSKMSILSVTAARLFFVRVLQHRPREKGSSFTNNSLPSN